MPTGEHGRAACPDVSVVMPVHDMPAKLVRRAIRSVRRQNHAGAIEVVLWDDGSGDPALPVRLRADARLVRRCHSAGR